MTTYILPAHMTESAVEFVLDATYSRGITYLYSQWEDYTRVWFSGASQVIYRATPSYGVALLSLVGEDHDLVSLIDSLQLVDMKSATEAYFAAEPLGKIRELMGLAMCASLTAQGGTFHAEMPRVMDDALASPDAPLFGAALESARILQLFPEVQERIENLRAELEHDPNWGALIQTIQKGWALANEPFQMPTRDPDKLLECAQAALQLNDFEAALQSADLVIAENPYVIQGHVVRARALDAMEDHWGAWAAMSVARLYAVAIESSEKDLEAFDVFIDRHFQHIQNGAEVTEIARHIAMTCAAALIEGSEGMLRVFLEHDSLWKSRWQFALITRGLLDSEGLIEQETDSIVVDLWRGDARLELGDTEGAIGYWKRWANRPEPFEEGSFDAWACAFYEQVLYAPPSVSSRFFGVVKMATDAKDWDRAIALTDEWKVCEPDSIAMWVWRGIAQTFSNRSMEAITSYTRAIELREQESDMIYFGEDPVATAYFNRACERANLGIVDELFFDDLQRAVSLSARFAEDAVSDDYLAVAWSDPRFEEALAKGLGAHEKRQINTML